MRMIRNIFSGIWCRVCGEFWMDETCKLSRLGCHK